MSRVAIVTATTGNPLLTKCIESVSNQTHSNVKHIVVVDGENRKSAVANAIIHTSSSARKKLTKIKLPESVGKDRWNGHRIYGAVTYLVDADYIMYLDEDNSIDPTHVEDCLKVIESGAQWAYTLRKIQDREGNFLCEDNCESLGAWPTVLGPNDYLIDVNCYFLPIQLAVMVSPLWYRKAREPGVEEVDRILCKSLFQIMPNFGCTHKYTVNYTAGNSAISVQPLFFERGNAEMLRRYDGNLPWVKKYE